MSRPCKPASPFRYFNSSPEVIRLVVMMYVRFPLSAECGRFALRTRDRHLPRNRALLVEQVRADVCRRHPPAAGEPDARVPALEVASRRDVREAQPRDDLPLAGR